MSGLNLHFDSMANTVKPLPSGDDGEVIARRGAANLATGPATWAAVFVLSAAVLWGGFVPGTARAHEGEPIVTPPAYQWDSGRAGVSGLAPGTPRLSPSCPAGPGRHCGCGDALALMRAGKAVVFDAGDLTTPAWIPAGPTTRPANQVAPPPPLLLSPASPRAPPLFS